MEAESTVLYHIHTSASLGHECIKDYLASLKNVLRSPEYIIHPFQLSVLLTISTISHYEEKVFEIVRSCISRTYHEEQKKNNSAWFRDMVPASTKIETVFAQVIIARCVNVEHQLICIYVVFLVLFQQLLKCVISALKTEI
jgi:Fanconi anemia group I protein